MSMTLQMRRICDKRIGFKLKIDVLQKTLEIELESSDKNLEKIKQWLGKVIAFPTGRAQRHHARRNQ
jgi:hypothetical protein